MNESNKKVIWIISYFAGGPSYCPRIPDYLLAEYLNRHGYESIVFAGSALHNSTQNFIEGKERSKSQDVDGVPFVYIKTRNYTGMKGESLSFVDFYRNLKKEYKKYPKPDLIMAAMPQPLSCLIGIKLAKKFKVPYITSIVDLWPLSIVEYAHMSRFNPAIVALYKYEKWVYKKSDQLVFTWEGAYDYIIDKKWDKAIPRSKFNYINIGVNLERFYFNRDNYTLNDPDLKTDKFVVMYCGSVRTANDIGTIVSCAELLDKKGYGDKVEFIIYGDGPDKDVLIERCKQSGIKNVKFKGFVDKKYIPYVLSQSNLNILNLLQAATQKYGNSSNKLFEYLATGNPVIANIDEGKYPIISKYKCGEVVKAGDTEAYVNAILHFLNMDKKEFDVYRNNALNAVKDFDTEKLNGEWEQIIAKLIKENKNNDN